MWYDRNGVRHAHPDMIMLTIPDVRQRADYDCGAACVAAVLRALGIKVPVELWDLANPVQGMPPDTVEAVLRGAGVRVVSGQMSAADLQHFTRSGAPVLCPVNSGGEGHWVVVTGVGRGRVHFHDPAAGPTSLRVKEFLPMWQDSHWLGGVYKNWGIVAG